MTVNNSYSTFFKSHVIQIVGNLSGTIFISGLIIEFGVRVSILGSRTVYDCK